MASAGEIYRNYTSTDTTSQSLTSNPLPQPPTSWGREGYFFKEWNTSRDGSGTSCQPGDNIPPAGVVYAIWYGDYIEAVKDSSGIEHPIKDTTSGYITSADENVFVAIYGTTTFAEVTAAIAADKAVLLWSEAENCVAYLAFKSTSTYGFSSINLHSVVNGLYYGHQYYLTSSGWTHEGDRSVVSPYGPVFTNSPSAPTPTAGSNNQYLATTAFVQTAINALDGGTIGTGSTTKTITSLSQSNGNVSATFSDIAFPVTSVNGQTGSVTTAEKFVITATAISGTNYYNLDKTFADINVAIGDNKYVTIEDIDMTYPYTTTVSQGVVFGATLIATGEGNQLMAVTDGILVVPPDSGTNAMGIAVHSTNVLPTISDIPSASSTTPLMDGTADVGIQTYIYARADHVHPTDTSRQATLVSGTNIKTINNESILGSGNISISAGTSNIFVAEYGTTTYAEISTALNGNKLLFCHVSWNNIVCPYIGVVNNQYAFSNLGAGESTVSLYVNSSDTWSYATSNLATKITASGILKGDGSGGVTTATSGTDYQAPLVSGTNIKTINNESILGSGNISISAGSSDVFIAEYGVTTYADILAAYEAGKAIFCQKIASTSLNNTKVVSILPLAYIGSSDTTASASRKAIFKNMSGNYSLDQTNITSWTVSGVSGQWSSENIETDTSVQGILSINKSGNSTYLYSNTVNGIVKDDGTGVLSAAVAGTDYQAPLVSGTNIKTINNESLLGSGNIPISGGDSTLFVIVTYSNYTYTADTTYADMTSATSNGKDIVVILIDQSQQVSWYYTMVYAPKTTSENFCFATENELGLLKHLLVNVSDAWWTVDINISDYAKKASPTFTGTPKAPTAAATTNNTQIATTAFVKTVINRTTAVSAADTNYTTYMARGMALNTSDTNPTVNGAISWTYK